MSRRAKALAASREGNFRQILGLRFFHGTAAEATDLLSQGGLLVVPAAPALKNLVADSEYTEALLNADLVITDSAFMVLLWNLLQGDSIRRLSGLRYLRHLIRKPEVRKSGATFWIMARPSSAEKNLSWLRSKGLSIAEEDLYIAPIYGRQIEDPVLLSRICERRPKHIIVTIGGGTQERLGLYLKQKLGFPVAIHCIGAAISFLSGDQVHIPDWADRFYLGWLFRCLSNPFRFIPRYWDARHLVPLLIQNRERLPEA